MGANDQTTKELIEAIANVVIAHADQLTDLDRAIGDADHGVNLTRGFRAVLARMDTIGVMPLGKALSEVGTTLIRSVGGASGPLYGKLFVTVGKHMDEAGVGSQDARVRAGEDAIRVLMGLGRSDVGQKTMLDVWVPVLDARRAVRGAALLPQIRRRATIAALDLRQQVCAADRAQLIE